MAKTVKGETNVELLKIEPNKIAEIENLKSEVLEVVKKNPFIEITDSKTYKAATESRKALRDISLKVEKQDTAIASFFVGLRKKVGTFLVGDEVGINKLSRDPFDTQDTEVKRWEKLLEDEKNKKAEDEKRQREEKIDEINNIVAEINGKIAGMTYATHGDDTISIHKMIKERKGTFGIYDVYFDPHVELFYTSINSKIEALEGENSELENQRKTAITDHIAEIEMTVKNLILAATFETIDETTKTIVEVISVQYDFQEFESDFESKSDELQALWKTTKKNLEDVKELADLRAEKLFNERSAILLEIGMEKRESGDFYVHDLEYLKTTILADTDEHFNRTVENIERFIAGENAKPNLQIDNDDEPKPTIDSLNATGAAEALQAEPISNFEQAIKTTIESTNAKPDFVKMAEEKLQSDTSSMGGAAAFHGATEMLEEVEKMEVDLTPDNFAKTVGELIDMLSIMNPETPLSSLTEVIVEGGKVTITPAE